MYSQLTKILSSKSLRQKQILPPYLVETIIVVLLVSATVIINWKMIRDGLNGMTDMRWHITWLQHFSKQLAEGIWYPRWLAGTNYGYGSPTFVFYPPLVYYLGSLLKISGLNIEKSFVNIETLKAVHGGFKAAIIGTGLPLFPLNIKELVNIPYIFVHQSLAIIILITIAWVWCCQDKKIIKETWRWGIMAIALAFMMSSLSLPIWSASSTLQIVQFPWRFLQIFSFVGAALCTVTVQGILKLKFPFKFLLSLVIIGILLVNFRYSYKLSRKFITIRNQGKGNIEHLIDVTTAINNPYADNLRDVPEYRPLLINSSSPPKPNLHQPRFSIIHGQAEIQLNQWKSYQRNFEVKIQEPATIKIRNYYYPAWHLYVNNKPYPINMSEDGTIEINLQKGIHQVELIYQWTSAFKVGVILSILSFLFLIIYWFKISVKISYKN